MKILIVCSSSSKSSEKRNFANLIKKIFIDQKNFIDTETEFFLRNISTIDDCLYELDSEFVRKEAAEFFDIMDMIFIETEANVRPWSHSHEKISILLRMCLRTQKPCFASSGAFQSLIYLSATDFEKRISIVNGNNGGKLTDIDKIQKSVFDLRPDEFFLDCITGDLYNYITYTHEWIPRANLGLHSRLEVEVSDSIGKHIQKTPAYKPKDKEGFLKSRNKEIVIQRRMNTLQHWIFENMPRQFLVLEKNLWDPHPFKFVNPTKAFTILAECEKNRPQLIYIGKNIFASQFEISEAYAPTVEIVKNFIANRLNDIDCFINKISIKQRNTISKDNWINSETREMNNMPTLNFDYEKRLKVRPTSASNISHVGFSMKKPEVLEIIDNNCIQTKFIHSKEIHKQKPIVMEPKFKRGDSKEISMIQQLTQKKTPGIYLTQGEKELQEFFNGMPKTLNNTLKRTHQFTPIENENTDRRLKSGVESNPVQTLTLEFKDTQQNISPNKITDDKKAGSPRKRPPTQSSNQHLFNFKKNKREIREMLHPNSNKEHLPDSEFLWVPGNFTELKDRIVGNKKVVVLRPTSSNPYISKFHKTMFDVDQCRSKPIIRVSSPFLTTDQIKRKEDLEKKKKNLAGDFFKTGLDKNFHKT